MRGNIYSRIKSAISSVLFIGGLSLGIIFAQWRGADPSAWLEFAGAMLGSAVTVAAAVFIAEYQVEAPERRELRSIGEDAVRILEQLADLEAELTHGLSESSEWTVIAEEVERALHQLESRCRNANPHERWARDAISLLSQVPFDVDELYRRAEDETSATDASTFRQILFKTNYRLHSAVRLLT